MRELAAFLRRGAGFALIVAVVAGATTFLATRVQQPVYRAMASLVASQPAFVGSNVVAPPPVDASVYQAALLEGSVVPEALAAVRGTAVTPAQVETFKRHLTVRIDKKDLSSVIRIEVAGNDPVFAAQAANAVATALVAWDRDRARQALARSIDALMTSIRSIDAELASASQAARPALQALRDQRAGELAAARSRNDASVFVGLLEPLAVASPPAEAAGPRLVFRTFVAIVLALFGAYGWLFTRWSLDPHVRGREDVGALYAGPVLGEFPRTTRQERQLSGEAANFLRASVLVASRYQAPLVLAVTSADSGLERAGVALSLAESFARAGDRVLLVDGDLRGPGVTATLDGGSRDTPTLAVHLEDPHLDLPPTPIGVDARTAYDFVPSAGASPSPVELLARGLADKLESWRHGYDLIVIDTPPVLRYADALTIAPLCSGLVLVAGVGRSRRDRVRDAVAMLRESDANLLGTVLIEVPRAARRARLGAGASGVERSAAQAYRIAARRRQRGTRAMTNVRTKTKRSR